MIPHKVQLSGELARIVEIIGYGAALRLVHEFGGREIKIPKNPRPGQQLVDCIGLAAAQRMTDHYGTGRLEIPLGPAASYNQFIRGQAKRIAQGLKSGKNNVEIARDLACSVRTARNHKNGRKDDGEPGLFD